MGAKFISVYFDEYKKLDLILMHIRN